MVADIIENNNNNNNIESVQKKKCQSKYPFEIVPIDPVIEKELLRDFTGEKDGYVHVGPHKFTYPRTFVKHAENYYNFQAREDDIWVVTFPRSGTTWTLELVWMIAHDLDYERGQRELLGQRAPFFEWSNCVHDSTREQFVQENADNSKNQEFILKATTPGYEYLPFFKGQRVVKTHFPMSMLPPSIMQKRAKVVYVARNPKDVAVSYYHLCRLFRNMGFVADFSKFWDYFENDMLHWAPYWQHIREGWERRHEPNVLFMFYEDMNRDLPAAIRKMANFLDKPMTDDQVAKLADHLSIEKFRNNPSVNHSELKDVKICATTEAPFVRNGKSVVNGWQKEYTPEIIAKAQAWIDDNLAKTDMRFPDKL